MEKNWSVAPGEYLDEWAEDNGVSQGEVAQRLGVSRKHVNEIINCKASISPDLAAKLELVTGIPADAWLRYQAQYQADEARIHKAESLEPFGRSLGKPVGTYLRRIGATTATARQPGRLGWDFLSLLGCADVGSYHAMRDRYLDDGLGALALKENAQPLDKDLFMAWLAQGERTLASYPLEVAPYSRESLESVMPTLKNRAKRVDDAMLADFREILADGGVRLLYAPAPSGLPLYGATRWSDDGPVVCLTGRRNKDGYVIWTLFHELGHVVNDRDAMTLELHGEGGRKEREKPANEFARTWLFGSYGEVAFRGVTSRADLLDRANKVGVCPGLAVKVMHQKRWASHSMYNDLMKDVSFSCIA